MTKPRFFESDDGRTVMARYYTEAHVDGEPYDGEIGMAPSAIVHGLNWRDEEIARLEAELDAATRASHAPPPTERGWVCPKCGTADAPWVPKCCEGEA